jgi:hypothetical protein
MHSESSFRAKSGQFRALISHSTAVDATVDTELDLFGGGWSDNSTNITSLDLRTTTASAIGIGSEFLLYRRVKTPFRADSADTYERRVEAVVAVGTDTVEYTTGHTSFSGSAIGLTARIEDAVTAGTVVVNLKVDGATVLSVTLDTTNTVSSRTVVPIGAFSHGTDKNVSVEVIATSYDNAGSVTSGLTVVATLVNSGLVQSAQPAYMPGHIDGLAMTFNSVSTVNIAAGTARNSTNTANIDLPGTLTADITVGGANGLDTGSEAADTWYALYVIKDTAEILAVASLLSTSFTSPTMPAGYDTFRRVGAVRNTAGSAFANFRVRGTGRTRRVWYDAGFGDIGSMLNAGNATVETNVDLSGGIPPSSTMALLFTSFDSAATTDFWNLRAAGAAEDSASFRTAQIGTGAVLAPVEVPTDASQVIDYQLNNASAAISIFVMGYDDEI